ncbi:MAG TPA: immunoglobulin domain-containing protein, partial [Verrucomicrobiae bacterium]
GPCYFYEYDYVANSFTQVGAPGGGSTFGSAPFATSMLCLPDGGVLFVSGQNSSSLYEYMPTGTALVAGRPSINSITENADGSYHLTGVGLAGISAGAAYGDDEQMDSNYPLIRMTNSVSGNVYYARTFGWGSTTIQNPNPTTTEFVLPQGLPSGTYSLVVIANGNPSASQSFTYTPPLIPTSFTARSGSNALVALSWNSSAGATAYNLKRSLSSTGYFATIATLSGTTYTNTGLTNGITYYYEISAIGPNGPSSNSPAINATPAGPPPVPTGLVAIPGNFSVSLTFNSAYGATNYNVWRSTVNGGPYSIIGNLTGTNYVDAPVINGVTYYYVVSAVGPNGQSAISSQAGATPQIPLGLAYEGFIYSVGSLITGANGGNGWSNGWVDVSGSSGGSVISGSLSAGANAPSAFDARSSGNALFIGSNSRSGRWLDCSPAGSFAQAGYVNSSGNIGAPGTTLYISFLQRPGINGQFYELELHRGNLNDPGRIAGIGNDASDNNVYLRSEVPAGGNSTLWNLGAGSTNVNFYVVRIDYHGGSDDVYVYHNPHGKTESENEPVLTLPALQDMSFNGIAVAAYLNNVTVSVDEIRIGQTWSTALGNPPTFVMEPANQNLYSGQSAALSSLAQSSQPVSYQWYRTVNGSTNAINGQTNATLPFASAQLGDVGQYYVTASNALGVAASSVASIAVQPISIFVNGSSYLTVGSGSNLLVSASVGGTTPLALQWYKDGAAVAGATGATLALGSSGAFDAGQYTLVAVNTYGSVTSSVINVGANLGGLLAYEGFNYGQKNSDIGGAAGGFG